MFVVLVFHVFYTEGKTKHPENTFVFALLQDKTAVFFKLLLRLSFFYCGSLIYYTRMGSKQIFAQVEDEDDEDDVENDVENDDEDDDDHEDIDIDIVVVDDIDDDDIDINALFCLCSI